MNMKKCFAMMLTVSMLVMLLAACGSSADAPAAAEEPKAEEAAAPEEMVEETMEEPVEEENYETGDASLDNPRNQDGIGEKELLVVSFGTSFNDSRRVTIGAIEDALQEAYPDWSVCRAFTSQIIIDHIRSRDGEAIDNVTEALERAAANGVRTLVVQPTHLMSGFEYTDLKNELAEYADAFEQVVMGVPLLNTDEDFSRVAAAVKAATEEFDDGETAICFMGHGTEADSNGVYAGMQQVMEDAGYLNCFIGTVEAEPSVEDVLEAVRAGSYTKVVLRPLMIVAGDHANNDMAGDEEDSWKSIFEAAGYDVTCVVEGLGQLEAIREIIVAHAGDTIAQLG